MPNGGNVRDSAFAKIYKKTPALFGIDKTDSAAFYGWLVLSSGNSVRSSLPHDGIPRGLDSMGKSVLKLKPILKKQKNIKPLLHNNRLLGEAITLKTNIAASDAYITNSGFGDLLYFDSTDVTNHANNRTIRKIASTVDTLLTYWKRYTGSPLYTNYDSIVRKINLAFADVMDTISASPLKITGTKSVQTIPFLVKTNFRDIPEVPIPYIPFPNPTTYELLQNYPNPFNPTTTIPFKMLDDGFVTIVLYNILGQELVRLVDNEYFLLGEQEVELDANGLSSGIYFYRLYVNGNLQSNTMKMILLK
jgi:hypothetical protein